MTLLCFVETAGWLVATCFAGYFHFVRGNLNKSFKDIFNRFLVFFL